MSQPEKNTNEKYPMPWRATTRLPYESDPRQQLQRMRINQGLPNAGETLVAYDANSGLYGTRYHGTGKDFQLKSTRDLLYKGLHGLQTYIAREAERYIQYNSALYHAAKELRINHPPDRYEETLKQLPELEKAFGAAETAINSLREAELKDRIKVAQGLGSWITQEKPDIWVQLDTYVTPDTKRRQLAGCELLKLTGLNVDEQQVNGVTQPPLRPQITWEGIGMNDVSQTYSIAGVNAIYLPAGPTDRMPMQSAYPRGGLL